MYDIRHFIGEETKMGKTFVTLDIPSKVDEIAYRTITHTKPSFIPPLTASETNGNYHFSFDVTADDFVPLSALSKPMSPKEFLTFMKNMTRSALQCEDYQATFLNLLILDEYTYINPSNFDVRFIYVPIQQPIFTENELSSQVFQMTHHFVSDPTSPQWKDIVAKLWNLTINTSIYESADIFATLHKDFDEIPKIQPRIAPTRPAQIDTPPVAAVSQSQSPRSISAVQPVHTISKKEEKERKKAEKEAKKQAKIDEKNRKKAEREAAKLENKRKTPTSGGLFSSKKNKTPQPPPILPPHNDLTMIDDDVTMIDMPQSINANLYLIENDIPTLTIPVNQDIFVIGRNRNVVNYCFDSDVDRSISREHIRIIFTDGQYFITNISERNATYVNDSRIDPNTPPVMLNNGDIVKIGTRQLRFELAL